jgi:hypothetical protein
MDIHPRYCSDLKRMANMANMTNIYARALLLPAFSLTFCKSC